jgi:hypothetical protein
MRIVCLILAVILSIDWFYALYHEIQFFRIVNTPKNNGNIARIVIAGIFIIFVWGLTFASFFKGV